MKRPQYVYANIRELSTHEIDALLDAAAFAFETYDEVVGDLEMQKATRIDADIKRRELAGIMSKLHNKVMLYMKAK